MACKSFQMDSTFNIDPLSGTSYCHVCQVTMKTVQESRLKVHAKKEAHVKWLAIPQHHHGNDAASDNSDAKSIHVYDDDDDVEMDVDGVNTGERLNMEIDNGDEAISSLMAGRKLARKHYDDNKTSAQIAAHEFISAGASEGFYPYKSKLEMELFRILFGSRHNTSREFKKDLLKALKVLVEVMERVPVPERRDIKFYYGGRYWDSISDDNMRLLFISKQRQVANGKQVFVVPLTIFNDDTSGNRSKKWNKYESWFCSFAGLPFKSSDTVKFLTTSKTVKATDSAEVIAADLRELRDGIIVYDIATESEVLVHSKLAIEDQVEKIINFVSRTSEKLVQQRSVEETKEAMISAWSTHSTRLAGEAVPDLDRKKPRTFKKKSGLKVKPTKDAVQFHTEAWANELRKLAILDRFVLSSLGYATPNLNPLFGFEGVLKYAMQKTMDDLPTEPINVKPILIQRINTFNSWFSK
ncbi:hypothetical protein HK101_007969 [Irineochytrium annulatum]|nr:hypothetical protein HK101_007969 [Irineochytrium annulatum]